MLMLAHTDKISVDVCPVTRKNRYATNINLKQLFEKFTNSVSLIKICSSSARKKNLKFPLQYFWQPVAIGNLHCMQFR